MSSSPKYSRPSDTGLPRRSFVRRLGASLFAFAYAIPAILNSRTAYATNPCLFTSVRNCRYVGRNSVRIWIRECGCYVIYCEDVYSCELIGTNGTLCGTTTITRSCS